MEARLGVRLVNRSTRRLSLTAEGLLLTGRGHALLAEMDDIVETLSSRAEVVAGRLRVVAPFGFGRRYVALAVAAFRREHPATAGPWSFAPIPSNSPPTPGTWSSTSAISGIHSVPYPDRPLWARLHRRHRGAGRRLHVLRLGAGRGRRLRRG
jgi:hypothetical protein